MTTTPEQSGERSSRLPTTWNLRPLRSFAPTGVVVDQGQTFRGTEEIHRFLREAGAEFTYTTELIGAERIDDAHWVATNHLEGDLPGGVAEPNYRFTLDGDLITELVIGT